MVANSNGIQYLKYPMKPPKGECPYNLVELVDIGFCHWFNFFKYNAHTFVSIPVWEYTLICTQYIFENMLLGILVCFTNKVCRDIFDLKSTYK